MGQIALASDHCTLDTDVIHSGSNSPGIVIATRNVAFSKMSHSASNTTIEIIAHMRYDRYN